MELLRKTLLILCPLIFHIAGNSQTYTGTIIRVIDGDTYVFQTADGSFIVRMEGIDAPEKDQPFSRESGVFLSKYLDKKAVTKVSGTDRYGRRLGTLYVSKQNINLHSVKNGFAWHYKYAKNQEYARAEKNARKKRTGLWKASDPVPPWDWRKEK